MAEVFLCIVAATYTACTMAATDFGDNVLSTAKVPRGIITRQATLKIHLATETELGSGVICLVVATRGVATILASRGNFIVTAEGGLSIVDVSTTLLVDFVCVAKVVP